MSLDDPSTEPIPDLPPLPPLAPLNPAPVAAVQPSPPPAPLHALDRSRFQFMSGIPAGETAYIRDEDGNAVLSYRSFASIVGIIAALMSAVVLAAGAAGVVFLLSEQRLLPAAFALILSVAFSATIVLLIPPMDVTISDAGVPAITIIQERGVSFPTATYIVSTPDGKPVARIAKSFLSRLGRNRWLLYRADDFAPSGDAIEESLGRALVRKAWGKFAPVYESNVRISWNGAEAGWIIRRPDALGRADVLELDPASPLDRRVAVALAVLVLGSEP